MTRIRHLLLLSTLTLALVSTACRGEPAEPATIDEAAASIEAPATASPDAGVAYEPAYPAEVSQEGLEDEDKTQQEASHSHGGEEHAHDDGSHSHDEDKSHDEDDHDH